MRAAWLHIVATSAARVYALLIGLAALALTARMLGPEGRGIIAGVVTWVTLFATLGALSLGEVIVHRAASSQNGAWLRSLFGALICLAASLSLLTGIIALGLVYFHREIYGELPTWALVFGILALPFYLWERYGSQLLVSTGNLTFYNRRLIVTSTVGFILLAVVLLFLGFGVTGALIVTLASAAIVSVIGITKIWKLAGEQISTKAEIIFSLLKDGLKLHLNAVGGVFLSTMGILMVNYYLSTAEVGWFQLALQMTLILMILPQSVGVVLRKMMAECGPDGLWEQQKRVLIQMLCIMLVLSILCYFLAPWILILLAGQEFSPSIPIFRVLLISVFGLSLSYGMANQWIGRGLFLQTALFTLFFGVLNFILNLVFIPRFGMIGAAWSIAAVYSIGSLTNLGMAVYVENRYRRRSALYESAS